MTINPRKRLKVAGTLSDAHPTFVSLVRHGANQTPFNVIKSDDSSEMKIEKTSKGFTLEAGIEIAKIEFLSAKFSDEAAVNAYLTGLGFSDYKIEKGEGDIGFVVPGVDASAFDGETQAIPFENDGTVLWAGKLLPEVQKGLEKKDSEGTANPADSAAPKWLTAKGDSVVTKFDWYLSYESNGKTIKDVMADAMGDGVPIGYDEASRAFKQAMGNIVKSGDLASLPTLATEFGQFLQHLASFTATKAATNADDVKTILDKFLEEAPAASEPPDPSTEQKKDETKQAAPAVDVGIQAVLDRLAALETAQKDSAKKSADSISELEAKLRTAETELENSKKSATETATQLAQVTRLRQTRASDDTPIPTPTQKKEETAPVLTRLQKNAMGIRD